MSRDKKTGTLLKAEEAQLSLESWIQKKGQNPWQPGYFKTESPITTAREAFAQFCAEVKPNKCQRDTGASWALWQACVDSTESLTQLREECITWQAKTLELEHKCEQLQGEKKSLEEAWETEKLLSSHLAVGAPEAYETQMGQEPLHEWAKQIELQERCQQLEMEKAQWETQRQELKAELGKLRQDLELGQGRLAALLKANQEDRETCRNLQESYAQCQAEIETLRKQTSTQQDANALAVAGPAVGPGSEGQLELEVGPGAGSSLQSPLAWAPELAAPDPLEAEPMVQEERLPHLPGPSGGLHQGPQARNWKYKPGWKRLCRVCGAWGRAGRRGGAWDCPWCRAMPTPWRVPFSPRGGHYFPGRARAAAAAPYSMRAPEMQEPLRGWRHPADPWVGPPRGGPYRGRPCRRRDGSAAGPGPWECHQCRVINYPHRIDCYKCHFPRMMGFPQRNEHPFQE